MCAKLEGLISFLVNMCGHVPLTDEKINLKKHENKQCQHAVCVTKNRLTQMYYYDSYITSMNFNHAHYVLIAVTSSVKIFSVNFVCWHYSQNSFLQNNPYILLFMMHDFTSLSCQVASNICFTRSETRIL